MHLNRVLLPLPLGPMMHTTSWGMILTDMPLRTSFFPNDMCRSLVSMIA